MAVILMGVHVKPVPQAVLVMGQRKMNVMRGLIHQPALNLVSHVLEGVTRISREHPPAPPVLVVISATVGKKLFARR